MRNFVVLIAFLSIFPLISACAVSPSTPAPLESVAPHSIQTSSEHNNIDVVILPLGMKIVSANYEPFSSEDYGNRLIYSLRLAKKDEELGEVIVYESKLLYRME